MPREKKSFSSLFVILFFTLVVFLTLVPKVHAHGVYVFARVEGDRIITESYFGDERKVKNGVIKVYDPSGELLLEGKTDEKGLFSFRIPKETDLKIVLEASMGHRAEYELKAEELTDRVSSVKQRARGPGLLQAGEGVVIILIVAGILYFGRKWRLRSKKEKAL